MTTEATIATEKPAVRPPRELVKSTSFLLKRLGWAIKDRTFAAYEEAGVNPYHHGVLCTLAEKPRETQGAIADALGYDRSWLVGLLDELEEQGLIERKRDPADRRRHLVSLRPEGEQKLAELRAISRRVEDEFLGGLDRAERQRLHDLLLAVAAHNDPRYRQG